MSEPNRRQRRESASLVWQGVQGRIKGGARGAAAPGPQFRGARIFGKCKK